MNIDSILAHLYDIDDRLNNLVAREQKDALSWHEHCCMIMGLRKYCIDPLKQGVDEVKFEFPEPVFDGTFKVAEFKSDPLKYVTDYCLADVKMMEGIFRNMKQFNKKDLKYGNVVELRSGSRCVLCKYCTYGCDSVDTFICVDGLGQWCYSLYSSDLKFANATFEHAADIMKVYKDYTCQELLWERKEKPELTDVEKTILANLGEKYKYIARDKDGELWIYYDKPSKNNWTWFTATTDISISSMMTGFNHLFKFIKWEDEEAYVISYLLED